MTLLRSRHGALLMLLAVLLAGCDGGDEAPVTETPTAPATASPGSTPPATATASPEPTATDTATPAAPRPTGVMLVDIDSGAAETLYAGDSFASTGGFEDDGSLWIAIASENRSLHFDGDGALIEEVEGYRTGDEPRCTRIPGDEPRAEIEGQEYPVTCGVFSPDGLRMLYFVDVEDSDHPQGEYAAWVLDLDSDRTVLLTDQLRHCGGCDARAGPAWSPSGWYVIVAETGGGEEGAVVYLADTELGETTVVARGSNVNEAGRQPQWSPVEDALIAPGEDGSTQLMRPAEGTTTRIDVPWPARFDETGTYVYSYAVRGDPFAFGTETSIASAETGALVATWTGRPPFLWPEPSGVTAVDGEPAALLEGCNDLKDECDPTEPCINGTAVYHPALDAPHCLEASLSSEWSPDRAQVAAARRSEGGAAMPPPYSEAWEIVLYDLDVGTERLLVGDIRPPGGSPPQLRWSPDGTRILVQWPRPEGL